MAFVDMHIFSRDFLHFVMSLLLLTFTLGGYLISVAYCLFFHYYLSNISELMALVSCQCAQKMFHFSLHMIIV